MDKTYDRRSQDVGNIVALEHVNVRIPDQVLATAFYVQGLGFTVRRASAIHVPAYSGALNIRYAQPR